MPEGPLPFVEDVATLMPSWVLRVWPPHLQSIDGKSLASANETRSSKVFFLFNGIA